MMVLPMADTQLARPAQNATRHRMSYALLAHVKQLKRLPAAKPMRTN